MRKIPLWSKLCWTQFPSVYVHCGPRRDEPEARIHYAEWVRDRDAGHLFAGTLYGLLAHSISYNGGRVDRFCDTGPSTEDLPFYSSFLVAAYHTLWRFDLGWHRISYRASQWERLPRVLPRLPPLWTHCENWLPWSNACCQCDTFAVAWGRWCYVQLRCLDICADLLDSGGHDFPRTEHLLALQSSREKGGNISKSGARGAIWMAPQPGQKVGDFGDLWSQRRMLDQPDQRTEGTIFLPLLSMNQDVVGEAIKVPNAILREVRHPTRHVSPERLRNHFIFPDFAIGDDVPLFPVIYLCSPEPGGFGHHKFSGQSLPMSGQHSCIGGGVFYVSLKGKCPTEQFGTCPEKLKAKRAFVQPSVKFSDDQWWLMERWVDTFFEVIGISWFHLYIFVRCFYSKKSTKIILIVSLLGDRAEVSLLADDINKEPLSPDPCNIISFECREESWGWGFLCPVPRL